MKINKTLVVGLALVLALSLTPLASAQGVLFVENDRVSIGTSTPTAPLDVNIGSDTPGSGNSVIRMERIGPVAFQLKNTNEAWFWNFSAVTGATGAFRVSRSGTGQVEMELDGNGDLTVTGDVFSTTCTTACAPDYVFEPDYELMPLTELAAFIETEKHLPNVPSAEELVGPISLNQMQMKLLEKVEELTLYTLQQQQTIESLQARLEAIER